ncbi:SusC/RagA family TonB-linked outer membrane protein [Mongoliitalea lutea]|uniref:SusC/RagA family TonB-linked outer membrane protein n=1 Tax=Mongoliitalea lutea TaxID=849756 RepID=A0A8J3D0Z0_9BACT|nr:SusC/RagA family TonB-linked outer membrane protein [Mongoliitalea lutea]GHB47647.1 SusC/RagA family TonB-linked outer membrane protein [Mongoliitalea lutea]
MMMLKIYKIKRLLLLAWCFFGFLILLNSANAQESLLVTGTVTDKETGEPLITALISVKGGTSGTAVDASGNFRISVAPNTILIISSIGYKAKEIIANQDPLIISLEPNEESLDEVVVIGYGRVRKSDATGAVSSVKLDPLNKGLILTPQDALVGKIAGVNVVPGTGAPGSEGIIRIRMGASLSASNDPLIVIDGVPIAGSAPLSSINPNDIESFTVLKDASATAIYGSRASNGVVIITTKKGAARSGKPQVSYTANFMVNRVYDFFDVLSADEYREIFPVKAIAPEDFQLGSASTDWQREIYRTSFGTDHSVSLSGNSLNVPYRVSVGYTNQDGIISENNFQRSNVSLGVSPKFFDSHLSLDINFKGIWENERPISTGVIGSAISFDPTRPVREQHPNNIGLGYFVWMNEGNPISLAPTNPVANLFLTSRLNKEFRTLGNIALDYVVHGFEDLRINTNFGYDIRNRDFSEIIPDNAPATFTSIRNDGRGRQLFSENQNTNFIFTTYANYNKTVRNRNNFDAMGGYEWQRFWYSINPQSIVRDVVDTSVPDEDALYLLSFFTRVNYSIGSKILFTGTLRADGSSRFSQENRWGYFPSGAVAYRLTEEAFIKNISAISDLKFRVSYGKTGQQDIGGYHPSLATYTVSTNAQRYLFGNEWINMMRPNGYDPNIRWETTSTYNLGFDFSLFKDYVFGSIDAYHRTTNDLLNRIAVPAGSNFTNIIETNIGSMRNQGVEFALGGTPIKKNNLEWTISGNFTYNKATITKLNTIDTEDNFVKTGTISRRDFQIHKVGHTPNTFFLLQQAYDDNGNPLEGQYIGRDGAITSSEQDANKYVTGKSSLPPYFYGISTRVTYKSWDFGMNGHGSFGNYVLNYQQAGQTLMSLFSSEGVSSNISRQALDRGFTMERYFSDMFLESGSFFRFDNITAGYTINNIWKEGSMLRLALSAQNMLLLTRYSGVDPEIFNGLDNNVYQRPRIFTCSINFNF